MNDFSELLAVFRHHMKDSDAYVEAIDPDLKSNFRLFFKDIQDKTELKMDEHGARSLSGFLKFIATGAMTYKDSPNSPEASYFMSLIKTFVNAFNGLPGSDIFDTAYLTDSVVTRISFAVSVCDFIEEIVPMTQAQKNMLQYCKTTILLAYFSWDEHEKLSEKSQMYKEFLLKNYYEKAVSSKFVNISIPETKT